MENVDEICRDEVVAAETTVIPLIGPSPPPAVRSCTKRELSRRRIGHLAGQPFQCRLAALHSPSLFFVHVNDDGTGDLIRQLNSLLDRLYPLLPAAVVQCADLDSYWVLADADDERFWSRVRVIEPVQPNGRVRVLHVDYGHMEMVPTSRLHPLLDEIADIPQLAIACSLASIHPIGENKVNDMYIKGFHFLFWCQSIEILTISRIASIGQSMPFASSLN